MIDVIQEKIDQTNYWDLLILDIQSKYFDDEIYVYIEKDAVTCWKLSFISCYKASYETDTNWRGEFKVKNTGPKSGYYGQDISLIEYADDEHSIQCTLDLSIMTMNIVCKDILVEEIKMSDTSFFGKDN
ncbi:hypothetical protein [Enterococcus sp. LJL51]|uniref:hypothetical protein n=1 Tax=Enterococcus sp. LJL51 TaxID=3416656 RepID=UPI003CEB16F1